MKDKYLEEYIERKKRYNWGFEHGFNNCFNKIKKLIESQEVISIDDYGFKQSLLAELEKFKELK